MSERLASAVLWLVLLLGLSEMVGFAISHWPASAIVGAIVLAIAAWNTRVGTHHDA